MVGLSYLGCCMLGLRGEAVSGCVVKKLIEEGVSSASLGEDIFASSSVFFD
jgi:hypothetical protein